MARNVTTASLALHRETLERVRQIADEQTGGVFSRAAAQLLELGLAAFELLWEPPEEFAPRSGSQLVDLIRRRRAASASAGESRQSLASVLSLPELQGGPDAAETPAETPAEDSLPPLVIPPVPCQDGGGFDPEDLL